MAVEVAGVQIASHPPIFGGRRDNSAITNRNKRLGTYPPIWYILLQLNEFSRLQGSGGVSLCHVVPRT